MIIQMKVIVCAVFSYGAILLSAVQEDLLGVCYHSIESY